VKEACRAFFDRYKDAELPLVNQFECALLRLTRKYTILSVYPQQRRLIEKELETAPELVRFVRPPTALDRTFLFELATHRQMFERMKTLPEDMMRQWLAEILKTEASIETAFRQERSKLSNSEKQVGRRESYGMGGRHYAFKNILVNLGIEQREPPAPGGEAKRD
jgi:hypothetical protein